MKQNFYLKKPTNSVRGNCLCYLYKIWKN